MFLYNVKYGAVCYRYGLGDCIFVANMGAVSVHYTGMVLNLTLLSTRDKNS